MPVFNVILVYDDCTKYCVSRFNVHTSHPNWRARLAAGVTFECRLRNCACTAVLITTRALLLMLAPPINFFHHRQPLRLLPPCPPDCSTRPLRSTCPSSCASSKLQRQDVAKHTEHHHLLLRRSNKIVISNTNLSSPLSQVQFPSTQTYPHLLCCYVFPPRDCHGPGSTPLCLAQLFILDSSDSV